MIKKAKAKKAKAKIKPKLKQKQSKIKIKRIRSSKRSVRIPVFFRLEHETYAALKSYAKEKRVSIRSLIEEAIQDLIFQHTADMIEEEIKKEEEVNPLTIQEQTPLQK